MMISTPPLPGVGHTYLVITPAGEIDSRPHHRFQLWDGRLGARVASDGHTVRVLADLARRHRCHVLAVQSDGFDPTPDEWHRIQDLWPRCLAVTLTKKIAAPLLPGLLLTPPDDQIFEHGLAAALQGTGVFDAEYDAKQDVTFWRGNCSGNGLRGQVVAALRSEPDADVLLTGGWRGASWYGAPSWSAALPDDFFAASETPLADQLRYRRLLTIDGNTVGSNSTWTLASDSAVIHVGEWEPYWWRFATAGEHYLTVGTDLRRLPQAIAEARRRGRELASAARALLLDLYTPTRLLERLQHDFADALQRLQSFR